MAEDSEYRELLLDVGELCKDVQELCKDVEELLEGDNNFELETLTSCIRNLAACSKTLHHCKEVIITVINMKYDLPYADEIEEEEDP